MSRFSIKKWLLSTMMLLSLVSCNQNSSNEERLPASTGVRYPHKPDFAKIIAPYLDSQGFLDREFPPTVAFASPFLTDFYGIIATKDNQIPQIIADFVPKQASIVDETSHSIKLAFEQGFELEFYPFSSIELSGHKLDISHAVVSGDTWRENQQNVKSFFSLLEAMKLSDNYFIENEAFESEKLVYANLNKTPTKVVIDSKLERFNQSSNAVLLFAEKVHGNDADAKKLSEIMNNNQLDWLGLEMLNTDMQPLLDKYNQSEKGSEAYQSTRQELIDYFADAWNARAGEKTSGEENYYFKLVELAHTLDIDVIAIEHASLPFLFFRYGETDFGASVRSLWWAQHLPKEGKGIVFGGGAHYNRDGAINVQDFILKDNPNRPILSITDVTQSWH